MIDQGFVQPFADARAPEGIQVLAPGVGQPGAHFQAVGLHQIQRAQQAIEAGEHAQVFLGVIEIGFAEGLRIHAGVHIALEGQQRLLGVFRGERGRPAAETRGVEPADLVGNVHQFADLRGRQLAQLQDQLLGVVEVLRLGEALGRRRCFIVEGLGG
ncbi:hypothetical protein D3C81_1647570 [compost metagenome]